MEGYKKYRTIHRISYIVFFLYLLFISLGNHTFGLDPDFVPYLIVIPFVFYCAITVGMEILVRKEIRKKKIEQKKIRKTEKQGFKNRRMISYS